MPEAYRREQGNERKGIRTQTFEKTEKFAGNVIRVQVGGEENKVRVETKALFDSLFPE